MSPFNPPISRTDTEGRGTTQYIFYRIAFTRHLSLQEMSADIHILTPLGCHEEIHFADDNTALFYLTMTLEAGTPLHNLTHLSITIITIDLLLLFYSLLPRPLPVQISLLMIIIIILHNMKSGVELIVMAWEEKCIQICIKSCAKPQSTQASDSFFFNIRRRYLI